MLSTFVGPLAWAQGDGTAVAATTTQTSLLTAGAATGKWSMPGNFLTAQGQMLRLRASGRISTPAATQGNITFNVTAAAINIVTTPTFTSLASQTNITWLLDLLITIRSVGDGTLATALGTGDFRSALVSATNLVNLIPATAPAVGTGFPSSTAAIIDLQATWSNATAGNTITLHQYLLESVV